MNNIPEDVRRFILTNIVSIPYLEAMLLIRNEDERNWSVSDVAKRLFIDDKAAEPILKKLHEAGIITIINPWPLLYRYQPKDDDLREIIDQLAITYSGHLVEVTNLIYSNIKQNAQKFANAFIWKKDS